MGVAEEAAQEVKQFEVWWADMPEPIGRRPVLLLSRSPAYRYLSRVIVVEVTSTVRAIPQEIRLGRNEGLSRGSVANFDNVHVVPLRNLTRRVGALAIRRHAEVKRAVGFALGWPELTQL